MKIAKLTALIALLFLSFVAGAQEPYRLNPGDIMDISVWNEEALQQQILVLPDGTISFPLVGIIEVANRTPAEVQEALKAKLSRLIPDPEINLSVRAVDGNNIYIIGKVNQPGRIPMTRPTDVMQALSLAGGFTTYAKSDSIQILRRTGNKQQVIRFDYTKIEDGKALETNILLRSGDTIVVP
ncbi:MAG: polysaccharide export protein [Gammaproteobacteria bacterium]|jgi:polysaccharide export outer membrane protein|nr:polysaccharide export protein [Gammaproteobacteria bacterium]